MSSNTGLSCVIAVLVAVSACSDDEGVLSSTSPTRVSSGGGHRIKLEAVVSDRSGACPALTFRLGGISVATTQNTDFETPCEQVVNGAAIEAQGYAKLAELGASPLSSIRSVGGGAANDTWTIIRLKALRVPAKKAESEHAAMGTARLAWRGIGHDA